ncbi:aminoacyltransferase [Candidatus Peribacteria bacterium]|nr:MAG: aminoacyltransferase [Candidatus Peribacteria bacterium]
MTIRLLTSAEDLALYSTWIAQHPDGTLWQSLEWKTYQEALGRTVRVYVEIGDGKSNYAKALSDKSEIGASAMVVIDRTTGGFSTWDMQRGPVVASGFQLSAFREFLEKIIVDAKKDKCISIFLSPMTNDQLPITHPSTRHEQPEATRILDLTLSDDDLLKQMHQKGRYNMKVAQKNGIRIEQSADVAAYATLASDTAKRDGFSGGSVKRYKTFLEKIPGSFLLLAYADHSPAPIAGLIGVTYGKTGIYYYGASDYQHRSLMAPYLLQWQAIQHCKAAGCTHYDLLGIAPPDTGNDHPWAGISDFKAKFGGTVLSYPAEKEIVLKPFIKMLLQMKRKVMG